jgi:hypothetical protein
VDNSFKDDVTVILLLDVFFMGAMCGKMGTGICCGVWWGVGGGKRYFLYLTIREYYKYNLPYTHVDILNHHPESLFKGTVSRLIFIRRK